MAQGVRESFIFRGCVVVWLEFLLDLPAAGVVGSDAVNVNNDEVGDVGTEKKCMTNPQNSSTQTTDSLSISAKSAAEIVTHAERMSGIEMSARIGNPSNVDREYHIG